MNRADLLYNAKVFFIAAVVCLFIAFGATRFMSPGDLGVQKIFSMVMFCAVLLSLGGFTGGLYYLVLGIFRKKDWQPAPEDLKIQYFYPDEELAKIRKMLQKELGTELVGQPELLCEGLDAALPEDSRSELQQFLDGNSPVHVQYRLGGVVPTSRRQIKIEVLVGRGHDDPKGHWCKLRFQADCAIKLESSQSWKKISNDAQLSGSPMPASIVAPIRELLVSKYQARGGPVSLKPSFSLVSGEKGCLAKVETLPRQTMGGFSSALGIAHFVSAVDALEHELS